MHRLILTVVLLSILRPTPAAAQDESWVQGIDGRRYVAVISSDIDEAAAWYARALGLTELDRWTSDDGSRRIINLRSDALFIELIHREDAVDVDYARGFFKFGFEVADVDAVADRVGEATGERPRVLDFPQHDVRLIQIRDPDGNILQIFEALHD